ncbi:hypothetical protein OG21DRAFT_1508820 [Imleria badia]|nr:hypothetical protein OG21DRAFT_1508820 [Imleria badia]
MERLGSMVREHRRHKHALMYFSVATLVIEKMSPYALAGIAFSVLMNMEDPTLMPSLSVHTYTGSCFNHVH